MARLEVWATIKTALSLAGPVLLVFLATFLVCELAILIFFFVTFVVISAQD